MSGPTSRTVARCDVRHAGVWHLQQERPAFLDRAAGQGLVQPEPLRDQVGGSSADRDLDHELGAVRGEQPDADQVGVGDLDRPPSDHLQRVLARGGEQLRADLDRRRQPPLLQAGFVVQAGVADRGAGREGERVDQLLVLGAELALGCCRSGRGCRTPRRERGSGRRGRSPSADARREIRMIGRRRLCAAAGWVAGR